MVTAQSIPALRSSLEKENSTQCQEFDIFVQAAGGDGDVIGGTLPLLLRPGHASPVMGGHRALGTGHWRWGADCNGTFAVADIYHQYHPVIPNILSPKLPPILCNTITNIPFEMTHIDPSVHQ